MATTPNPATTTTTTTAAATVTRPNTKPTTTTTSTTTPPRPQSPFQQIHHHPIYPVPVIRTQTQNPTNHQGILYPVASSGRGFIPRPAIRPQQDHPTTNTTATTTTHQRAYQPRGVGVAYRPNSIVGGSPSSRSHPLHHHPHPHPHPHPAPAQLDHQHHVMSSRQHPTHLQHPNYIGGVSSGPVLGSGSGSGSGPPIKGIPVAGQHKIAASPSQVSDSNGYKRDRSRDDNLVVVRDRKVRITDGASLYVLCRSWLRNGFPEESQHHYGDSIKPLPRPLLPKKEVDEEVETEKEDEESVDDLSAQDILKRHIKHAKRVRARLREERLKRIARYKSRLALLLPPQVEQFRNDAATGN